VARNTVPISVALHSLDKEMLNGEQVVCRKRGEVRTSEVMQLKGDVLNNKEI